jgi:hypothetical protein
LYQQLEELAPSAVRHGDEAETALLQRFSFDGLE